MKQSAEFIALFYPTLPSFWSTAPRFQTAFYGNIFDFENDGDSIAFKTIFDDGETETHLISLTKQSGNTFTGNGLVSEEKQTSITLELVQYSNSTGKSFYGTWVEDSKEYSCLIILQN